MSTVLFAGSIRKGALCLLVLLGLLLAHGGFTSQAQGFGYVMLMGRGSVHEDSPWRGARFKVSRILINMPHDSQSFQICFTGSATPGADFYVKARHGGGEVALSGSGCFTDSWGSGDSWYEGAERAYTIFGKSDNVTDPRETITATVSAVNWPAGYSLLGSSASINFTINGR